ncbi:SMARCD2 [Cervus elaphus hippelaphus]|uniref:SMARCD2 n=1 Tax=Cervus elaphus hippelaphus TaxID=46360 RepID=A0A212D6L0_CEREH|nr:SMARCD2 [Cervus elaphus hippelaphus]
MEGMGYGPRWAPPLTYAPPLAHFPQRPGMSPGSRMPMAGLQVGPPAGSPFGTAAPLRPGMPPTMMDPFRKRLLVPQAQPPMPAQRRGLKRRKMADKVLPQRAEGDSAGTTGTPGGTPAGDKVASWELRVEGKLLDDLDQTIARKRMEIQEAIKKPLTKKTACYDIDVEVDDPLKAQMSNFLASTTNQQEIASLDVKIHETIESINQLKTQRDFMLSFSTDPQDFIQEWLRSQRRDLKIITDVIGNPEEERRAAFYHQPWAQEAVGRHIFAKVQQRRQELEQVLGIRLT